VDPMFMEAAVGHFAVYDFREFLGMVMPSTSRAAVG